MPLTADPVLLPLVIPPSWTELLLSIRKVCPSAVLAGGCLRDLDNGREVKDLDVFINAEGIDEALAAITRLMEAGFDVSYDETFESGKVYPADQCLEVSLVADMLDHDLPVQLIFTNWATQSIVDRFDYGICRLSWDGEALVQAPEYGEDKAAQVFRLRRDRETPLAMRGSVHRYARLVAKYPEWTWWPYEDPAPWGTIEAII